MSELRRLAYEVAARDAAWDALPMVIADVVTGEIIHTTEFGADLFGYTPNELIGKSVEILLPDSLREAHARWRQDVKIPERRVTGLGRQVQGLRKDGSLFPAHVGLTSVQCQDRTLGIAFIVDLSPSSRAFSVSSESDHVTPPLSPILSGKNLLSGLLLFVLVAVLVFWGYLASSGSDLTVPDEPEEQYLAAISAMKRQDYVIAERLLSPVAYTGANSVLIRGLGRSVCITWAGIKRLWRNAVAWLLLHPM